MAARSESDDSSKNAFERLEVVGTPDVLSAGPGHMFQQLKDSTEVPRQALEVMERGTELVKIRSAGRRYRRTFYIDKEGLILRYQGSCKNHLWRLFHCNSTQDQSCISIKQVKEIRDGAKPDTSKTASTAKSVTSRPGYRRFVLVVGEEERTLVLVAPNVQLKDIWVNGLKYLMAKRAVADPAEQRRMWIQERFIKADKNENGKLDTKEVIKLMMSLNVCPSKANLVEQYMKNEPQEVDVENFVKLYDMLSSREEIDELFNKYSRGKEHVGVDELAEFFEKEQNEKLPAVKLEEVIEMSESCPMLKEKKLMSSAGFLAMFAIPMMNVRKPLCRAVYHDMSRPLNEYFINASHNTYLEGNQLTGHSSVEQYIRALNHRCRCVELDVYDGDDNEPIVYHGSTMTTQILFKDILEAINEYAFKKSPYPVILSIENHCSVEQQKYMAKYFRQIFGEKLFTEPLPEGSTCLPSPKQLRGRIVLKAKKPRPVAPVSDSDESSTDIDSELDEDAGKPVHENTKDQGLDVVDWPTKSKPHKVKIAAELSDCVVICQSAKFKSFEDSARHMTFVNMSSFSENKALKLSTEGGGKKFLKHNAWQLSRIYPSGKRMDSSNYDPVPMWLAGCQIVALNFQTRDIPLLLNYGFYEDNGACGYVLKPEFMRSSSPQFSVDGPFPTEWKQMLTLRIISGYMLPKKDVNDESSILDPYVEVEIYGVKNDRSTLKTSTVKNNGFHPVWNETVTFAVNCPQIALVMLRIKDDSMGTDALIAQYCLPMRSMQTGHRMVALRDTNGEVVGPSSLYVHISIAQAK